MIVKVSPLGPFPAGSSVSGLSAREYSIQIEGGQTVMVPESDAVMVSVLLDMPQAIGDCQIFLPEAKQGRRVSFYFTHTATQFVFTGIEPGSVVSNGELSVDKGNLIVFYCVSESRRLWAREAPL